MPQDKRKSISYRSFVTCDDPKGVIECGSIRKSKISSKLKDQQIVNKVIEGEKKQEKLSTDRSLAVNEDKKEMSIAKITRQLESPCFELLEVSKGAHKLNHVINSWSKNKEGRNDVAFDLLRGALELEESLVRLGRLQEEASSIMLQSKRKQKHKLEERTFDGMLSEVNDKGSEQFGYVQDEKLHMGFGRPRKSCDGLKNVVRDSLLRQNVINNPIFEEHFDCRKLRSSDMPSTSSSQSSSMVLSSNFAPSDSSTCSTASQRRKRKDSNLIVKLMGLESPPSSPRRYREGEKIMNSSKPMYDIDSLKTRKPYFHAEEFGKKQKTVEEMLETLNFKGLLRSNSWNVRTLQSIESEVFTLKDRRIDDRPPIVIMKTSRSQFLNQKESTTPRFPGERVMKPAFNRRAIEESISNDGAKSCEKFELAEVCYEAGVSRQKVAFPRTKSSENMEEKRKKSDMTKLNEVERVSLTRGKVEKKDLKLSDELRARNQEKMTTPKMKRRKDGSFTSKLYTSSPLNVTSNVILDHRKQETSKISGQSKKNRLASESKKSVGKEKGRDSIERVETASTCDNGCVQPTVKTRIVDDAQDQNRLEICPIQIRDNGFDNQNSVPEIKEAIECIQNDKKRPIFEMTTSCVDEDPDNSSSSYSEITSVSASECCSVDHIDENNIPSVDAKSVITRDSGMVSNKETDYEASAQYLTPRTKLKELLLSSPLFLSHLDKLFDLKALPYIVPHDKDESHVDVGNDRVLIDYAKEILQLRSSQFARVLPKTVTYTKKPLNWFSPDRLLEEICTEIEDSRCYQMPADDVNFSSGNLYLILERDLSFMSGIWETGWRRMFSEDEVERVVKEVDKFILGKLIDEALVDLIA